VNSSLQVKNTLIKITSHQMASKGQKIVTQQKKMNKTHFGFYLLRFSGEKPVFLVAIGPLSGEFW